MDRNFDAVVVGLINPLWTYAVVLISLHDLDLLCQLNYVTFCFPSFFFIVTWYGDGCVILQDH